MDSEKLIREEFLLGLELKEKARKSKKNHPVFLEAAEHLEKAGRLSLEAATDPHLDPEARVQREVFGSYYLYEQKSCLSAFHYERRETSLAAKEQDEAVEHLARAIDLSESAISNVPQEISAALARHIKVWRFYREGDLIRSMFIKARAALDRKDLVGALDYYKRIINRSTTTIENASDLDPAYERIARGNQYGSLVNAHQAYAHIYMDRFGVMEEASDQGKIRADMGDEIFLHLFMAHKYAKEAFRANPEWLDYSEIGDKLLCEFKDLLRLNKPAWAEFLDLASDDPELITIMKRLDVDRFKESQAERAIKDNSWVRLWARGGFFVTAVLLVGLVAFLISTRATYWWQALLGLATWETIVVIVGAPTLRTEGTLTETRFMELMKLAVNQQFRLFEMFLQATKKLASGKSEGRESRPAKKSE